MARGKKTDYTAEDIDVLEGLEPVRKSPGMFLGEASTQVLRAFREIYENSVDVFSKGMNDYVSVVLEGTKLPQTFTVIDHGPGIPTEKHKKTGISTLTTIFTYLHSGSNFDKASKGKSTSRGKHGVGSSCTNACSDSFVVWTCRDKQWYTQSFSKGKPTSKVEKCKFPTKFQKRGAKKDKGTIIQFTPDYTILPKTIIKEDELFSFIKENADLNKGLTVRFIGQNKDETVQNKRGIIAVLEDYIESKNKVNVLGKPFVFESENLDVALQWSDLDGENVLSHVNLSRTQDGGTHVQGMFDAITKAFKDAAKRGDDFTASDLREGLIAVIHYKCNDDDYSGQNKEKLNTVSAVKIVKEALAKPLEKWIKSNSKLVREISVRATQIKKAKAEAKAITKAASTLKGSNSKKGQLLGSKLIHCSKKCKPEDVELILVEGNSAAGSVAQARDSSFQEVLKCRGKGLNVFKSTLSKALANAEISSLLVALGADEKKLRKEGVVDKFRVGKILLFSDPDVDAPLRGDTKVLTLDGKQTIEDLAKLWEETSRPIWVLGRDPKGNIVPALARNPCVKKEVKEYYKLILDDGSVIECTDKHPWVVDSCAEERAVKRKGLYYSETELLKVGDILNTFYTGSLAVDRRYLDDEYLQDVVYKICQNSGHKIARIEKVYSDKPVKFYCMTVPDTGNFFVCDKDGNGVLSSNSHIDALWLTWIYKFAPAAFEKEMVYKVNIPLYQAVWYEKGKDRRCFGNTLEEIYKQAPKNAHVLRAKGLGENLPHQLETFINPDTRNLTLITLPKAKKDIEEFLKIMGDDVETRKRILDIKPRIIK